MYVVLGLQHRTALVMTEFFFPAQTEKTGTGKTGRISSSFCVECGIYMILVNARLS